MYRPLLILLVISFQISPQTMLSGNVGGMTFDSASNPYIVTDSIVVQEGKTTIIKPGCVFLFKQYSGIVVNGSLAVEGTQQSPVIFTSIYDNKYSPKAKQLPNPFDWNGIRINQQAGKVTISNIILKYSVYGIKSQINTLSMNNAILNANGQYNFTVGDKIQLVIDGIPYNYTYEKSGNENVDSAKKPGGGIKSDSIKNAENGIKADNVTITTSDSKADSSKIADNTIKIDNAKIVDRSIKSDSIKKVSSDINSGSVKKTDSNKKSDHKGLFRKVAPVTLAATGVVTGVATIVFFKSMSNAGKAYTTEVDPSRQEDFLQKQHSALIAEIVMGGITGVCLSVSVVLFLTNIKHTKKHAMVTLSPVLGDKKGINITMVF